MKGRFVAGADPITADEQKEFIEYLRGRKCAWWHWISNLWLITDRSGTVEARELRDELARIAPNARIIVLPTTRTTGWSGKGPKSKERNMFNWLRKTWGRD